MQLSIEELIAKLPEKMTRLGPSGILIAPDGTTSEPPCTYVYRLTMAKNETMWAAGYVFLAAIEPYGNFHIEYGETLQEALSNLYGWVELEGGN